MSEPTIRVVSCRGCGNLTRAMGESSCQWCGWYIADDSKAPASIPPTKETPTDG